jgi:SEC-C motif domain protein
MSATGTPCPCGRLDERRRPIALADCCGRYLENFADCPAPDAAQLMRSRYTAFVLGRVEYLLATWHPLHRPANLTLEPATKWLGLEVKVHRVLADDRAEVAFVARSALNGRATRLQENSCFVREDGRWFYTEGNLS